MLLQWPIANIRVEYSRRTWSVRGNKLFPLLRSSRNVTQEKSISTKKRKGWIMYATYNERVALVVQIMQLDRRALCFVLAESRARYS